MTWLPFDLHPEYPPGGIPRAELHARYGEAFHTRLRGQFEASGLVYNPPAAVVSNTLAALRLTEHARELGVQRACHDRLMQAYWEEGRDLGDREELASLAAELGLPADETADVLAGDAYLERVRGTTAQAHSIGVTGVPAFLLDRRLLVMGAQPAAVFEQALAQLGRPPLG